MRRATLPLVLLAALCPLAACAGTGSAHRATEAGAPEGAGTTLTVFAASSLTESFDEIAELFEAAHPGVEVSTSYAGSQTLVDQLDNGAPVDVLTTADTTSMQRAVDAGFVGEPTPFASNVLTLITPAGNPAGIIGLDSSLDGKRLVICAADVPCGRATAELADLLGVTLNPVSEENKVTDVRARVTSGEADAGIVYRTDARAAGDAVVTIEIPGAERVVNVYPVAVSTEAPHADLARAFVDLVLSDEGARVLSDHGFSVGGE